MVAPGSNRGKPHSRGRGGGHRATGLLTAGARHAPLKASICKEALGLGSLQPGLSVPAMAAERDPTGLPESVSLRFLKGFQLSVRILGEAEARCSREIGPLDRGLNVFPRSSKLD
jgi:hypothetical protein